MAKRGAQEGARARARPAAARAGAREVLERGRAAGVGRCEARGGGGGGKGGRATHSSRPSIRGRCRTPKWAQRAGNTRAQPQRQAISSRRCTSFNGWPLSRPLCGIFRPPIESSVNAIDDSASAHRRRLASTSRVPHTRRPFASAASPELGTSAAAFASPLLNRASPFGERTLAWPDEPPAHKQRQRERRPQPLAASRSTSRGRPGHILRRRRLTPTPSQRQ
jgi:hypothetical protein